MWRARPRLRDEDRQMSSSAGARRETRGRVPRRVPPGRGTGRGKALACRAYRLASPEGRRLLHALFLLLEGDGRLPLARFARLPKAPRLPPGAAAPAGIAGTPCR